MRKHSFEHVAKEAMRETPAADKLYEEMGKHTRNPELKAFADDLMVHEPALRDWLKSELDGNSDGAEKVFAYLERHGISRERSGDPAERQRRPRRGCATPGARVLPSEDLADQAAMVLKNWRTPPST